MTGIMSTEVLCKNHVVTTMFFKVLEVDPVFRPCAYSFAYPYIFFFPGNKYDLFTC